MRAGTVILAHPGEPLSPHDLWWAWNADPLILAGLLLTAWAYWSGRRRGTRKDWYFAGGLVAIGIALLSPLEPLAGALASAHMVQHLLLMLVAAPLLALSTPGPALLRGMPRTLRRAVARRLRLVHRITRVLRHPAPVWLLHVGTLWFWHASVPYQAALDHEVIHALEHASFLLTGVLFWAMIGQIRRTAPGFGILVVFATAMQGVFLSALLTFAGTAWYPGYAETTNPWGLAPLADQQLAGAIMWVPGGVVYVATALALLVAWIRQSEDPESSGADAEHRLPTVPAGSDRREATTT